MSFDLDFEVFAGDFRLQCSIATDAERVSLIGPNGSGKSTLLRALVGGLEPRRGVIRIGGDVLFERNDGVLLPAEKRHVGYVPQSGALFPHLSALANVSFALLSELEKPTSKERHDRAREALMRFGAEDLAEKKPSEMSGGECRRVALARALVRRPRLLVLDEPFAGVDVSRRPSLRESLLAEVLDIGARLMVTTHDAADALELTEEVAVCEQGRVAGVSELSVLCAESGSDFVRTFLKQADRTSR